MIFVWRSVLMGCIALLGGVASLSAGASAQPILLAEISVPGDFQVCNSPPRDPFEAVRPTLRYLDYGVAIGSASLPVTANAGDSADVDPSNSPDFNNFATLITNGVNEVLGWRVDILDPNGLAGVTARDRPEAVMLLDSVGPDLVGARLAFVRFVIDSIDAGVFLCPGGTGNFVTMDGRWQFWGTPRLELSVDSRGCNPCSAAQLAAFVAIVTNPGLPLTTEIKLTVTLPNGAPVDLVGGSVEHVVPSGPSEIPLVSFLVPGDVPKGTYLLEAALVDPARGVTLARDSIRAVKQ
jgi:hypothetical protein